MADVFPYYAGFSFTWARNFLREELHSAATSPTVLDPWNGSGTTTLAALANGYRSIGVDLNPVANIIAQLRVSVCQSPELFKPSLIQPNEETSCHADPLLAWFSQRTANQLRAWSIALSAQSDMVASLGFVSLFRSVRKLTERFQGSNPTWVRRPGADEIKVDVDPEYLDAMILDQQKQVKERLRESPYPHNGSNLSLVTATATSLPIASGSIDAILTSPPYLTRIDYAVAYSRELAILGIDSFGDRNFRANLMGTTLIREDAVSNGLPYGSLARDLVHRISTHSSKASAGYYKKQVTQYLQDLTRSLSEISRVANDRAVLIMVVQDSYYKDIPIHLASICTEEALLRGWVLCSESPAKVTRSLAQLNTAARAYPKGNVCETVITLRKVSNGQR